MNPAVDTALMANSSQHSQPCNESNIFNDIGPIWCLF
jgi:hypothetical protein